MPQSALGGRNMREAVSSGLRGLDQTKKISLGTIRRLRDEKGEGASISSSNRNGPERAIDLHGVSARELTPLHT